MLLTDSHGVVRTSQLLALALLTSALTAACSAPVLAADAPITERAQKRPMEKVLIDFAAREDIARWSASSDAVMGGISTTRVSAGVSNTLVFSGVVKLENNGGFSTIGAPSRTRGGDDLRDYESVALRVKGDGKTYQLWLFNGARRPVWVGRFETTADQWQTVVLPFDKFVAENGFGQRVRLAGRFSPNQINSYRLLISDKQSGSFALELEWIKAIR
jgi:NADH dehydrogenase [ubiquinone] 1 alpha subcomplex assembly factor 1